MLRTRAYNRSNVGLTLNDIFTTSELTGEHVHVYGNHHDHHVSPLLTDDYIACIYAYEPVREKINNWGPDNV